MKYAEDIPLDRFLEKLKLIAGILIVKKTRQGTRDI